MDNLEKALQITGTGLFIVFAVMAIIALVTWLTGKIFVSMERRTSAKTGTESKSSSTAGSKGGNNGGTT